MNFMEFCTNITFVDLNTVQDVTIEQLKKQEQLNFFFCKLTIT